MLAKEGLSNDDLGVARGHTVFQEIQPRAGFKTGAFVSGSLRGLLPWNGSPMSVTCFFFNALRAVLLPPEMALSALEQSVVHWIAPVEMSSWPWNSFTHLSFLPLV